MRFYTQEECEAWIKNRHLQLPKAGPGIQQEELHFEGQEPGRILHLAWWIAKNMPCRDEALFWVTDPTISDSSVNWHLYYRLRQSYGDNRLWYEAPGHLFLGHETEDLATFLYLAFLSFWDGYLLTAAGYVHASFDHHSYVQFYSDVETNLEDVRTELLPGFTTTAT
jgi:hypothetical protein